MLLNKELLKLAVKAAIDAGIKTLEYYNQNIEVEVKADNSPLTIADLESNKIISHFLKETGIPVLSEESYTNDYTIRKHWDTLWIVDPLDGTKEFIKKNNEYTVNIALVKNSIPVLGIIYAPALDLLYYGDEMGGSFKVKNAKELQFNELWSEKFRIKLPVKRSTQELIVVASKSHRNKETEDYITKIEKRFGAIDIQSYGSSLKLCMVAEGCADIYPRLSPTMEWDIAAGHAIAKFAGCCISRIPDFSEVNYNKENLLNPWFIVYNKKAVKEELLPPGY